MRSTLQRTVPAFVLLLGGLLAAAPAAHAGIEAWKQESSRRINAQIECQVNGRCPDHAHFVYEDGIDFAVHSLDYLQLEISAQRERVASQWPDGGNVCARDRFLGRLAELETVVGERRRLETLDRYLAQVFTVVQTPVPTGMGPELRRWTLFDGEADEIQLAVEDEIAGSGDCRVESDEVRRLLVDAAVRINAYLARFNRPLMEKGAARLRIIADHWSWFISEGYSQYPWELGWNSWVTDVGASIFDLPRLQWILAHPAIGYEYDDRDTGHAVLLIEALGLTRYWFSDDGDSRRYLSLSGVCRLRDDRRIAWGGLVGYNGFGAGFTARGRNEWSVAVSADLLSLAGRTKGRYDSLAEMSFAGIER